MRFLLVTLALVLLLLVGLALLAIRLSDEMGCDATDCGASPVTLTASPLPPTG